MNCRRALGLISLVLDGEATEQQRRLLDFHLLGCSSCRRAMEMTSDISRLTRDMPSPMPPEDLETGIRKILDTDADMKLTARKRRSAVLTVPAAVALFLIAITILPISSTGDGISESASQEIAVGSSKNIQVHMASKSGIRTVPLSEYTRQASLISF